MRWRLDEVTLIKVFVNHEEQGCKVEVGGLIGDFIYYPITITQSVNGLRDGNRLNLIEDDSGVLGQQVDGFVWYAHHPEFRSPAQRRSRCFFSHRNYGFTVSSRSTTAAAAASLKSESGPGRVSSTRSSGTTRITVPSGTTTPSSASAARGSSSRRARKVSSFHDRAIAFASPRCNGRSVPRSLPALRLIFLFNWQSQQ